MKSKTINQRKYFLLAAGLLFGFQLFSQSGNDTVQFVFYNNDSWTVLNEAHPNQPCKTINLEITELQSASIYDSIVSFEDASNGNIIIISKKDFLADKHSYNFEKNLIDNKIAFGHDGFSSIEYVKNNFHIELEGIYISNKSHRTIKNLTGDDFPVFILPYLKDKQGKSAVKAYRIKKYFQYLIVVTGGGGGAGSYENFILIDLYNRCWIFAKDVETGIVNFVPISSQKDPFSKNGEKIWYDVIFK